MVEFINSSKEHRPDAVSRDFLTAFCVGPIGISDTSQGAVARAWRVRVVGSEILIAAAGEGGWVDEFVHLTLVDGIGVREVDLAFTQSADLVVVLEREDGNLWLYWFDPLIPGLVLENMGLGRNPKLVLDDPFDVTNSDVQLFYISDALDTLVYRTQRERYDNENLTPVVGVANIFLEDAIRDSRYRLHLVASERDLVSGRYPKGFFNILSTQLFKLNKSDAIDEVVFSTIVALVEVQIIIGSISADDMEALFSVGVAEVVSIVINGPPVSDDLGEPVFLVANAIVMSIVITAEVLEDNVGEPVFSVTSAVVDLQIDIIQDFEDAMDEPTFSAITALVEVA